MKKRAGCFLALLCVLTLAGCCTSNNVEKVESNLSRPTVEGGLMAEEINVEPVSGDVQKQVQNTQLEVDELHKPEETDKKNVEQGQGNSDIQEKEESLVDATDAVETEQDSQINVRQDIIDVNEIKEQGGVIEFAGDMTYKEFMDLNWVSDIDNSLDGGVSVYVVKIYYPEGLEHNKIGKIENCEAVGIYRADNGEYLGGSFRERVAQN